jgi:hypothetical protein
MLSARQENERTLARLTGISEDEAAERLAFNVSIRTDSDHSCAFGQHVRSLLALTLTIADEQERADLEIALDGQASGTARQTLFAHIDAEQMVISREPPATITKAPTKPHDLHAKLAACYAAAVAVAHAIGGERRDRLALPFAVRFDKLGLTPPMLDRPIILTDTVLAGAGGVGSGFMWALESLNVTGTLDVADPKIVSGGNLNRCLHFGDADVGKGKAAALCANAHLPGVTLKPFAGTFGDLRRQRSRIKRVVVTVDSRPARRAIQSEMPLEVLDASTTDISEVVVHSHAQPNDGACLSCIYHHIPQEDERQRSIAAGLGVAYEDIKDKELIDAALARQLSEIHGLDAKAMEGVALTSLHKQLCAAQVLKMPGGEQALAPFAFVSNLAGVLLALELVRFDGDRAAAARANYLSLDPWSPPHGRARRHRPRREDCEFCGDGGHQDVMAAVWPERFATAPRVTAA